MSDAELLEKFSRDGYVVIENAFNAEEVARMQEEADAIFFVCLHEKVVVC